jgi:hypothetical protein
MHTRVRALGSSISNTHPKRTHEEGDPMNKKNTLLTLTIRNANGATVGHISLEQAAEDAHEHEHRTSARAEEITEAQRRMLCRLASRLGYEGNAAREYIERRLETPKDRRAASRLIDVLQEETNRSNGAGHAGAS